MVHLCGLDAPVWTQYASYVDHAFTGQWGFVSNHSGMIGSVPAVKGCELLSVSQQEHGCEVMTLVENWLPYTLELAVLSLLLILLLALPIGTLAAARRNRALDQASRVFSFSGFALPSFLLGALVILLLYTSLAAANPYSPGNPFACDNSSFEQIYGSWHPALSQCYYQHLGSGGSTMMWGGQPSYTNALWGTSPTGLPTLDAFWYAAGHTPPPGMPGGRYFFWDLAIDHVLRLVLPALTIAYGAVAGLLRFVRNSMLEVMSLDFVRTARAKGVPEREVVRRHAGRNSLNVTVTVLGLTFATFLGGFAVTESLFNLYGVGALFAYSVLTPPDIGTIFGTTVLFTVIIIGANLIVDVVYGLLDPRVRLG
ncbi:MAG: ABC transporter permease [Thermoplasmata archaeon]|nr:ABC transporter permease [Thermoplasmata archaeon]